ncbi:ATP-dependent zinc metalloprotease FTSH 4, mitochondrial [Capsicum baccatum]|uniref:ATP-dependent zinc metalloprotease FTSH 4, mitochondrial n=1 Tax=Capsicum baccatum TaxID=33114 RepID=A0A2G2WIB2_CAPBA|nr:ATP-dependent zinc metalloprotease FTSH 4, mitochondrial [Capsicum baccatum]
MFSQLYVAMGERVVEELILGKSEITSGPSDDLKQATKFTRTMVTNFGMKKELDLLTHNYDDDGKSMSIDTRLLIV